jgi:hypothetical protein
MTDASTMSTHLGLLDFYDPTIKLPEAPHRDPRWVSLGKAGYSWGFFSWRGKMLGYVFRDDGVWWAIKTCCGTLKECGRERSGCVTAGRYVATTLACTECKRSCLPSGSN